MKMRILFTVADYVLVGIPSTMQIYHRNPPVVIRASISNSGSIYPSTLDYVKRRPRTSFYIHVHVLVRKIINCHADARKYFEKNKFAVPVQCDISKSSKH